MSVCHVAQELSHKCEIFRTMLKKGSIFPLLSFHVAGTGLKFVGQSLYVDVLCKLQDQIWK